MIPPELNMLLAELFPRLRTHWPDTDVKQLRAALEQYRIAGFGDSKRVAREHAEECIRDLHERIASLDTLTLDELTIGTPRNDRQAAWLKALLPLLQADDAAAWNDFSRVSHLTLKEHAIDAFGVTEAAAATLVSETLQRLRERMGLEPSSRYAGSERRGRKKEQLASLDWPYLKAIIRGEWMTSQLPLLKHDLASWTRLVGVMRPRLFGYVQFRWQIQPAEADEVVQETFVRVFRWVQRRDRTYLLEALFRLIANQVERSRSRQDKSRKQYNNFVRGLLQGQIGVRLDAPESDRVKNVAVPKFVEDEHPAADAIRNELPDYLRGVAKQVWQRDHQLVNTVLAMLAPLPPPGTLATDPARETLYSRFVRELSHFGTGESQVVAIVVDSLNEYPAPSFEEIADRCRGLQIALTPEDLVFLELLVACVSKNPPSTGHYESFQAALDGWKTETRRNVLALFVDEGRPIPSQLRRHSFYASIRNALMLMVDSRWALRLLGGADASRTPRIRRIPASRFKRLVSRFRRILSPDIDPQSSI